ncbi:MAG TPA: hypothetical protein VHK91_10155, partial [Flavisolibacter sp.]|nr:hypothetical protein [Flavisolibacter sp.]
IIAYQVAVQSYRGFTEVVQSAVDLNRHKLLTLLHITPPVDSEKEKELWRELSKANPKLTYDYKKEEAPPAPAPVKHSFLIRLLNRIGIK